MKNLKMIIFWSIILIAGAIALFFYTRSLAEAETAYIVTSRVQGTGNTNLTEINKEDAKLIDTQTQIVGKGNKSKVRFVTEEPQQKRLKSEPIEDNAGEDTLNPTIIAIGIEGNKNTLQGRIGAAGDNILIQAVPLQQAQPIKRGRSS